MSDFSSIQLNLIPPYAQEVDRFIKESVFEFDLLNKPLMPNFGNEMGRQYHITIKNGIHTNKSDKILEIIKENRIENIKAKFGSINYFNIKGEHDILYLEIKGSHVRDLNKIISENIKHTNMFIKYVPHLTLCYLKEGMAEKYLRKTLFVEYFIGLDLLFDRVEFCGYDGRKQSIKLYED